MHVKKGSSRNKHFGGVKLEMQRRTNSLGNHRQPKLTPREREEFINYLWFSSRDVTFERDLYWVASGR